MWLCEGLLAGQPGFPPASLGPGEFWGQVGLVACCLLQGGRVPVVQGSRTGVQLARQNRFSGASRWPGPVQVWRGPLPVLKSTGYFSPSLFLHRWLFPTGKDGSHLFCFFSYLFVLEDF